MEHFPRLNHWECWRCWNWKFNLNVVLGCRLQVTLRQMSIAVKVKLFYSFVWLWCCEKPEHLLFSQLSLYNFDIWLDTRPTNDMALIPTMSARLQYGCQAVSRCKIYMRGIWNYIENNTSLLQPWWILELRYAMNIHVFVNNNENRELMYVL